ncbi:MAG: hypothetical protein QOE89_3775 [Pseudonocardiales bacterium]|jgi:hypothetical protein|nr:hypothetical protein [Pseudonocardiales bacterium]
MTQRGTTAPPPRRTSRDISPASIGLLALLLAGLGLAIEVQPISLTSGTRSLYLGFTVAAGAVVLAIGAHLRLWLRLFTLAVLGLCLVTLITRSADLQKQRDQWQHRLNTVTTDLRNELPHG